LSVTILNFWGTLTSYRPQLNDNRNIKALIGFGWIGTRSKKIQKYHRILIGFSSAIIKAYKTS